MKIIIRNSRVNVSDVKIYNAPIKENKEEVNESIIPEELNTELAQALWKLAQEHGWVDDQWQPKGLSLTEAAILADEMGAVLKLKCRWKPFEVFWNKKYMRSDFQKAYGQTKTSSIADEMRRVFASVDNQ